LLALLPDVLTDGMHHACFRSFIDRYRADVLTGLCGLLDEAGQFVLQQPDGNVCLFGKICPLVGAQCRWLTSSPA